MQAHRQSFRQFHLPRSVAGTSGRGEDAAAHSQDTAEWDGVRQPG